jgi:hypothetical protein
MRQTFRPAEPSANPPAAAGADTDVRYGKVPLGDFIYKKEDFVR